MVESIYKKEFGYALPVHWVWVLIVAVVVVHIVFRVYAHERGPAKKSTRLFLASLRAIVCVSILLSALNWHVVNKKFRRPEVVLVFDSSTSLQHLDEIADSGKLLKAIQEIGLDRPSRLNILKTKLKSSGQSWIDELEQTFEISAYRVGETPERFDFSTHDELVDSLKADVGQSRLDKNIRDILKQSLGNKPAAIILFSDGIDSEDSEFKKSIRVANALKVPVYCIGVGEKKPARDLAVVDVQVNRRVFLNDLVEFQVALSADGSEGLASTLQLVDEESGEMIVEKDFTISSDQYRNFIRFRTRMNREGSRKYIVKTKPVEGEFDKSNNQRSVQIDVVSDQIRVLLAANYPSREFHYLKQFLGRDSKAHPDSPEEFANNRIQLKTFLQQADIEYADVDQHAIKLFPVTKKQLFEFDVVIFCDLKPNWAGDVAGGLGQNELDNLRDFVENRGGGVIFVAGPQHTPRSYAQSSIADLFPIEIESVVSPEDSVLENPFGFRKTVEGNRFLPMELGNENEPKPFHDLVGTFWYSSSSKTKPGARVLAEFALGGTPLPAIVLQNVGNGSVLYHAFPESYRWRYRTNDIFFGRYWSQMIQYLASSKLGGDQGMFLETDRKVYYRQEPVLVLANVFDASKSTNNIIPVTIRNPSGFERNITLRKSNEFDATYSASVENLGAGSYEVILVDDKNIKTTFDISDSSRESQRKPINDLNLKNLSSKTGGHYLPVTELEDLPDHLPRPDLIAIGGDPPWVLWHHWQFAAIFGGFLLGLCTLEWIVRKRCSML